MAGEFYRLFLKSPNFGSWLQTRTSEVYREWRRYYVEIMCNSDITLWTRETGRDEVECIDLMLRIKEEIVSFV
jgi:hypothetical protein